ncbi:hypothetical protein cypCar_00007578, partial [Cyprinus carpio]
GSGSAISGSGVVTRVIQASLTVAFDDMQDCMNLDRDGLYNLMKLANDVTYRRLSSYVRLSVHTASIIKYYALKSLNGYGNGPASHLIGVLFGYSEPGILSHQHALEFRNTGLDNSQKEAVSQKDVAIIYGPPGNGKTTTVVKVLCCAPSNVAVYNLVERLAKSKVKILRLGHPACLLEVRDKGQRSNLRREIGELRRELKNRDETAITQILKRAHVILATYTDMIDLRNIGASDDGPLKNVPNDHFELVVIDECAQALESSCWIALLKARKCILAGDYKQLPPTIKSQSTSPKFWENLAGVADVEETRIPLLLIETASCGLNDMEDTDEQSKGNQGEENIVALHIKPLTEAGVQVKDIVIIAPFNLKINCLINIQSCKSSEVGFLAEDRRINVAVTRARHQLVVMCDSQTVRNHDFLKSLVSEHGEVRTAFEYLEDRVVQNYICDEKNKQINSTDAASTKQKPKNHDKKTEQEQKKSANNKSLHLVRMHREQEKQQSVRQEPDPNASKSQSVKKPKGTSKGNIKIKAEATDIAAGAMPDDDLDVLIDAVVKADSFCGFVKCKASILTLGQLCLYFNRQYCPSHHIPEVHRCGDKAKAQAGMRISKEGVLYAGSGQKDKSIDPNKKAYLQRKLDSKLKDMASQTKTKAKDEEN